MTTNQNMTDEQQPPLCENYDDEPVLVLWPSGKVQRFPNLAKAKTMLMKQHYSYIVCNAIEAHTYRRTLPKVAERWKMPEEIVSREDVWQYLVDISEERNPWAKHADVPDTSTRLSKRTTAAGYTINHDKCREFENVKAPKQAKIIARSFLDFEDGCAVTDEDIEKHLHTLTVKDILKTKQPVKRIFTYYRQELLDKGCIKLRN